MCGVLRCVMAKLDARSTCGQLPASADHWECSTKSMPLARGDVIHVIVNGFPLDSRHANADRMCEEEYQTRV